MQFNQITYFLRTCETLNFTQAAIICCVSQPSLSASIKKLEEELGGALFIRNGRGINLTPLGIAMRDQFSKIEEARITARSVASQMVHSNREVINIGLMCTLSPKPILSTIVSLTQNDPNAELLIYDIRNSNSQELLLSHALDCIVTAHSEEFPDQFFTHTLMEEPMLLTMSASHHLACLDCINLSDLDGAMYVNRIKCEFGAIFHDELKLRKIELNTILHSEREDLVQNLVSEGAGISMMPKSAALSANLTIREINDLKIVRKISVVTLKNHQLNLETVQFIDALRSAHS